MSENFNMKEVHNYLRGRIICVMRRLLVVASKIIQPTYTFQRFGWQNLDSDPGTKIGGRSCTSWIPEWAQCGPNAAHRWVSRNI